MEERNQQPGEALRDIRQMMERSSRFISLSGLSGISAGICALAASWVARIMLGKYEFGIDGRNRYGAMDLLTLQLFGLAVITFVLAFAVSFLFTYKRAQKLQLPVWDHTSRRLLWNVMLPIAAGALFIIGMLKYNEWRFVAPACLVFYGLGLINGSKYTLSDIRYLGYLQIILGFINMWYVGYGLVFWALGFGVLHIVYGAIMWFKYESKN